MFDRLWKWLSGKKRTIAEMYWLVMIPGMSVLYPAGAPVELAKAVTLLGLVMTAVGLGHAAVKKATGEGK